MGMLTKGLTKAAKKKKATTKATKSKPARKNLAGVKNPKHSNLARNLGKSSQENIEKLYSAQEKIRNAAKKAGMSVKQYRKKNPNNKHVRTVYRMKPNIKANDLGETGGVRVYGGHYGPDIKAARKKINNKPTGGRKPKGYDPEPLELKLIEQIKVHPVKWNGEFGFGSGVERLKAIKGQLDAAKKAGFKSYKKYSDEKFR
jgi:hypothetical protein|tara:strand:+ start:74 stop:676 length:603 start_codon:yes stop_codon:yes gene_type:complete